MNPGILVSNLSVAVAYFIGGYAGLLIAVPPGNSSVVWPAAGIALACVVISGKRILPGIFLGSLLVQTSTYLDASSTERVLSSLLMGGTISVGVILQAWAGALLVKKLFRKDPGLLQERSILLFCLLAGPVACSISASLGSLVLWQMDILAIADMPLSWAIWWIGDSIGVLIFSPLFFCFFARPRRVWKYRISSVALPLCILVFIAFVVFRFTYFHELAYVKSEFEKTTSSYVDALRDSLDFNIEATNELKEFFDTAGIVPSNIFSAYARPKLERHPKIQALEWIPKVEHEERAMFENEIGVSIKTRDAAGEIRRAPDQDYYLAIKYLEPYAGNENALGYDITSLAMASNTAKTACASGDVAVTDAINLVQDDVGKLGIVFYAPVYRDGAAIENCANLAGIVASVFQLEEELGNIKAGMPGLMSSITLKKDSVEFYSDKTLINEAHAIPTDFQFELSYSFPVANASWGLIFTPEPGFITYYISWTIWLIIVGALIIAGISGMGLLMLTGRTLQTEDLIAQRTGELNEEILERAHATIIIALENKYLEMLAQDYSMQEIFDAITMSIEDVIPGAIASILLLDPGGKHLRHGSAAGLPEEFIKAVDGQAIGPRAGSCGTAAYLGRQVIVRDIETDPLWKDYRDDTLKHGLRACWSTPITGGNDKVLGTFAIYFREPRGPDEKSIDLINRIAKIAAITILRKKSEEQLTYHAKHDALTGLVNRHEFERRVEKLLEGAIGNKEEHALYFMDLDQFKIINDSCGHIAGDEMLRQLTTVLQDVVRKRDTLARLGGDEFGVLMEFCSLDDAYRVATSLQKAIQEYQFVWEDRTFRVGVSIGLVPITSSAASVSELLRDADAACYVAKDLGRNRIHIYHHDDEELARRSGELQWVTRIHDAIERDRFCLYAQKIMPLDGSPNLHYELLVRMLDEDGGIILPGVFLNAAERYNQISKLDHWVIDHALKLLQVYPDFMRRVDFCSINLSGQSLTDPDILGFITHSLKATKVEGSKLCFEITETAAISNMSRAIKFISTLKGAGCRFALDDFGSGLSSFGYLKHLPVDYLKIDGMFVRNIAEDRIDHAMVKSINEIGQVMGMKTIAEFVESGMVADMLKEIGVNYAQGYGIEKPVPLTDLLDKG